MKMAVLIVDDEPSVQTTWSTVIARYNRDHGGEAEFHPLFATSVDQADDLLNKHHVDCVITDLRLDQGTTNQRGETVIAHVRSKRAAPVAVMTGHQEEYEAADEGLAPIRVFVKEGDQYEQVLIWLHRLKDLMSVTSKAHRRFHEVFATLFHRALWKDWAAGDQSDNAIEAKVRHLVAQIGDEMTTGSIATKLWPEEFYVRNSLRNRLATGDLLNLNGTVFVVVSPPCDLANVDVPDCLLLAYCDPEIRDFASKVADKRVTSTAKAGDNLRRYFAQETLGAACHFLPKHADLGPWCVSFKKISSISREVLETKGMDGFVGACPRFCVNGPMAGNCHQAWRHNEQAQP